MSYLGQLACLGTPHGDKGGVPPQVVARMRAPDGCLRASKLGEVEGSKGSYVGLEGAYRRVTRAKLTSSASFALVGGLGFRV